MGKKKQISMIVTISVILILGGCKTASTVTNELEPISSREEVEDVAPFEKNVAPIEEYEIKYASGDFTVEDYKKLAELYAQKGMVKRQRDLLEQCYRLYKDEQCLLLLKEITVNLEEESDAIKAEADRLFTNLNTPEYADEAVGMLLSSEWQSIMMPKLWEGCRRYYMADAEGKFKLCFETGYDESGREYTNIWYLADGGSVKCIMRSTDSLHVLTTQVVDGKYQGEFESWLCMADSGDIYHEKGTFEKGLCAQDYTVWVKNGNGATDLFALWSNREDMDMTEYTGNFGDGGITSVAQPTEGQKNVLNGGNGNDNFIVYAYKADKNGYLFMNTSEGTEAASFVFDYSVLGLKPFPEVALYEPQSEMDSTEWVEQKINSIDVKVRIYDSNIEWFDGSRWHVLGEVSEYMKEDPLGAKEPKPAEDENEIKGVSKLEAYRNRGTGIIKKTVPESKPKPSKSSSSKAPSSSGTPAGLVTPPVPQQPLAPVPSTNTGSGGGNGGSSQSNGGGGQNTDGGNQNSDSGGQSDGGSNSGSSGSPDSGGGDSSGGGNDGGNNNGGDNSGGDVDIEWTDDIL